MIVARPVVEITISINAIVSKKVGLEQFNLLSPHPTSALNACTVVASFICQIPYSDKIVFRIRKFF